MGRRLDKPNAGGGSTDHSEELAHLWMCADTEADPWKKLCYELAGDLLHDHDMTGISLDNWLPARKFVETLVGSPILENGV